MFHSAGYFRGVLCPFYEHGLCHRPHCHYRHSRPASKEKKLPKLRSKLVTPQLQKKQTTSSDKQPTAVTEVEKEQKKDEEVVPDKPVSSTSLTSQTSGKIEEVPGGAEICERTVTEVSKLIGDVANFYGSSTENYPKSTSDKTGQSGFVTSSPTPPPPASEVSDEQTTATSLPSYAPENCLAVEANYSSLPSSADPDQGPSLSKSDDLQDAIGDESVGVALLENTLVTQRDIFGDNNDVMSDDDDDVDESAINSNIGDDVISEAPKLPSAEELASIEEQFKKVTALPSGVTPSETVATKKSQKSGNFVDVSVKKKWKAHSGNEVVREPVKLQTAQVVNSNFSASLDKASLYMGKKRVATPSEQVPTSKRPKLQLTTNAKVPTKIRQRFLDSFIDEFLKVDPHPEQTYEKALKEEKELFDRSSSRMIYMNVSTLALKRIRNQTQVKLDEMRKRSDARVEALRKSGDDGGATKGEVTDHASSSTPSNDLRLGSKDKNQQKNKNDEMKKLSSKPGAAAEGKKGWRSLEAELQAAFSSQSSQTASTGVAGSTSLTGLSGSTSDKAGDDVTTPESSSAVFSSSNFYAKKSHNSSCVSVEGETKKVLVKKKLKSKPTKDGVATCGKKERPSCATARQPSVEGRNSSLKRGRHSLEETPANQRSASSKEKLSYFTVKPGSREERGVAKEEPPVKRARLSTEDVPVVRTSAGDSLSDTTQIRHSGEENAPLISSTSADSASDKRRSGSGASSTDPIDLTAELFGDSDSDSGRGDGSMEASVFTMADDPKRVLEEEKSEDEGVGNSLGISFESALSGFDGGVANNMGGAKPKSGRNKSQVKKHKKKSKVKRSLDKSSEKQRRDSSLTCTDERRSSLTKDRRSSLANEGSPPTNEKMNEEDTLTNERRSSQTDGQKFPERRSKVPAQLDLSVFSLKSPSVRLAKTPTLTQQQSYRFPLTSPKSDDSPTLHDSLPIGVTCADDGGTKPGPASPTSATDRAGPSSEVKEATGTKMSAIPSYLPSGPLINLTKVAAIQKKKSIVSLVGKKERLVERKKATPKAPPTSSKAPPKPTYSIIRRKEIEMTAPLFFSHIQTYLLSEQQLVDNGYPRSTEHPGKASIYRESSKSPEIHPVGPNAMQHFCCRCGKPFIIYNSGQYQSLEECVYHYGRLIKTREYGEGMVSKYTCCQGRRDSAGCLVAKFHVTAGERPTLDDGYVTTEAPPPDSAYQPAVYALDCEMCYTTLGLQLTRVSVINMNFEPIYEQLVKPSHPIVDYNTRFSGLTADDFVGIATSLEDVQQDLLHMFFSDTILLGHSLESDLRALKIIHSSVVDTAIVFPHRKGPPYKRALKTLMAEFLQKFIQDSIDGGHDSLEDSKACMELMVWKIKQDLKRASRTSTS